MALVLKSLFLKVRNEAEEPLWPQGETGRQTAGGSVVHISSSHLFKPHLSSYVHFEDNFAPCPTLTTVSDAWPSFTGRCFA